MHYEGVNIQIIISYRYFYLVWNLCKWRTCDPVKFSKTQVPRLYSSIHICLHQQFFQTDKTLQIFFFPLAKIKIANFFISNWEIFEGLKCELCVFTKKRVNIFEQLYSRKFKLANQNRRLFFVQCIQQNEVGKHQTGIDFEFYKASCNGIINYKNYIGSPLTETALMEVSLQTIKQCALLYTIGRTVYILVYVVHVQCIYSFYYPSFT
eukprot:TRINITY_DN284_c0_g1_i2.p1 TRINITY_DN284_c0_g1~~TRINITY_DN284_c0_g1_i2.p1  ORF type:complete len:208 (+),score=-13.51 TRINITY_DN284_c0_g1_i2:298-921(+)